MARLILPPSQSASFSVGQAARFLGISVDTLRRWEKSGKITGQRTVSGRRVYSLELLKTLNPSGNISLLRPSNDYYPGFTKKNQQESIIKSAKKKTEEYTTPGQFEESKEPLLTPLPAYQYVQESMQNEVNKSTSPSNEGTKKSEQKEYSKIPDPFYYIPQPRKLPRLNLSAFTSFVLPALFIAGLFAVGTAFIPYLQSKKDSSTEGKIVLNRSKDTDGLASVLAASSSAQLLTLNADTTISKDLEVKGTSLFDGDITAPNILYGIRAGPNITISSGQTPTISATAPVLTAGTDISIDGLKINDSSTLATVRARGGCDSCLTDSDIANTLTISSSGSVDTGALSGTVSTGHGGTGISSYTKGDILYSNSTNSLNALAVGTTNQVLAVQNGIPSWVDSSTVTSSGVTSLNSLTGALSIAGGGINTVSASGATITVTGTEADTLDSVTTRGASTPNTITLSSATPLTLSGLSAGGLLKVTPTTGVVALASAGSDYESPLTFSNGLTRISNAVKLGGTLTANTDIPLGGFNLTFSGTGNVGIGTSNPSNHLLELAGPVAATGLGTYYDKANYSIRGIFQHMGNGSGIQSAGGLQIAAQGADQSMAGSGTIRFFTPSANSAGANTDATLTEKMTIQYDGNVGIGSATPGTKLDVTGTGRFSSTLTLSSLSAGGLIKANAASGDLALASAGTDYESPLTFSNGLTRTSNTVTLGGTLTGATDIATGGFNLTYSGTGNIGIGTTSPTASIHALRNDASYEFKLERTSATARAYGLAVGSSGEFLIDDITATTRRLTLDTNGNIGIGTSTTNAPLSFGTALGNKTYLYDGGVGSSYGFGIQNNLMQIFASTSTDRVGIGYGGGSATFNETLTVKGANVGIGSTSPNSKLLVSGGAVTIGGASAGLYYNPTGSTTASGRYYFLEDENSTTLRTGVFNNTTNGYQNLEIDASNIYLNSRTGSATPPGNVGIGTSNAQRKLYVDTSSAPALGIGTGGTERVTLGLATGADQWFTGAVANDAALRAPSSDLWIGTFASNKIRFDTNNAQRATIDSTGNVGIGSTTPIGLLNVNGAATGKALAILNQTGDQAIFTASTSGSTKFVIANDGNVGINSNGPTDKLLVNLGTAAVDSGITITGTTSTFGDLGIKITNTGTGGRTWYIDSTNNSSGYGGGKLAFVAGLGGTNVMTLTNGNVGIGTSGPVSPLAVENATAGQFGGGTGQTFSIKNTSSSNSSTTLALFPNSGSDFDIMLWGSGASTPNQVVLDQRNNAPLSISTNDTTRLLIKGDGNVGIGSTNPGNTLDVTGTGRFSSTLTASNGFTQTTGALSLTGTSGSIALTGFGTTSITSTTATGTINTLADDSLTTGTLLSLSHNGDPGANLSYKLLDISDTHPGGFTDTGLSRVNIAESRTYNGGLSAGDTENFFNMTRTLGVNAGINAFSMNGAFMRLASSGSITAGSLTDTSNILALEQNCGTSVTCSGDVLKITNKGTGNGLSINDGTNTLFKVSSGGNVGIGTSTLSNVRLTMYGGSGSGATYLSLNNADTSGREYFVGSTGGANGQGAGKFVIWDNTAGANRFTIDSAGNVGINTTSAGSTKLQIDSTADTQLLLTSSGPSIKFANNATLGSSTMNGILAQATSAGHYGLSAGDFLLAAYGNSRGNIYINSNYSGTGTTNLILQPTAGNVGIGSASPRGQLDVTGTMYASGLSAVQTGSGYICNNLAGKSPNWEITVTTSSTACNTTASDQRLKTDIVPISNELDVLGALDQLKGVYYNWDLSNPYNAGEPGTRQIGVIAQDVEKVFPGLVTTDDYGNQYKHLDYPKLTGFLIEVAKAQKAQISDIQNHLGITQPQDITIVSSDGASKISFGNVNGLLTITNAAKDPTIQFDPETGSGYFAGELVAKNIRAEHIEGIDILTNKINSLEASLASQSAQVASPSSQLADTLLNSFINSASTSSELKLDKLTAVSSLVSTGKTQLADTNIAGKLTVGTITFDDIDSAINTLGVLKIQNNFLATAVDFFSGAIRLDKTGDITTNGKVYAKEVSTDKLTITQGPDASASGVLSPSAGVATIASGQTSVTIHTSALTDKSLIFATPISAPVAVAAKRIDDTTFEITIKESQTSEIKLNWWIIN